MIMKALGEFFLCNTCVFLNQLKIERNMINKFLAYINKIFHIILFVLISIDICVVCNHAVLFAVISQ